MRHLTRFLFVLALVVGVAGVGRAAAQGGQLPAEMIGVTWQLSGFQKGGAAIDVAGGGLTIQFSADGNVSGSAGCNNFVGGFTAGEAGKLTLGTLASTKRLCTPDSVNARENDYLMALQGVTDYSLSGGQLTLTGGDATLTYDAGTAGGSAGPATLPTTAGAADNAALLATLAALLVLGGLWMRRATGARR